MLVVFEENPDRNRVDQMHQLPVEGDVPVGTDIVHDPVREFLVVRIITEHPADDAPLFRRVIIIRPVFLVILAIFYDSVLLSIFFLYTRLCAFCTRAAARQNYH